MSERPRDSGLAHAFSICACVLLASCGGDSSRPDERESKPQQTRAAAARLAGSRSVGRPARVRGPNRALVEPRYVSAEVAARFLDDDDGVFVVRDAGRSWVYPQFIMTAHHIANLTIDDRPLMVTYCKLSECATLFSREVDGVSTDFEWLTSLYNGTLVMADARSGSQWVQFVGECLSGPQLGARLEVIRRLRRTSWGAARKLPDPRVLAPVGPVEEYRGFMRAMEQDQIGLHMLRQVGTPDSRLGPYAKGVGVSVQGDACFFAAADVLRHGVVEAEVGGWSLAVVAGRSREDEPDVYRRLLGDRVVHLERRDGAIVEGRTGSRLGADGRFIDGELKSKRLERPLAVFAYWFAWSSFHPKTTIWRASSE